MNGWYVTTKDITHWTATNKRSAEETLPLLIKKLILASCNPKEINFPSGDDVAIGGWDGILDVEINNTFIPTGKSGWEIGTNEDVKGKVDDDYEKRLNEPEPFILEQDSFVFVTSRLWSKRDAWVKDKKSTNKWKNIKGINASSLADWLEQCPSVHRWFSEFIGKRSSELWDIDLAWQGFSCCTEKKLTTSFFLHERGKEKTLLIKQLNNAPNNYKIKAESKNEAYGFILAAIQQDELLSSRCLIVKTQQVWDYMATSNASLILIPKGFLPTEIGLAIDNQHTVIIPIDNYDTEKPLIHLKRQPRLIRQSAIEKLGFNEDLACKLYQQSKGYFQPLLRQPLLKPIDKIIPDWLNETPPEILFSLFFATTWSDKKKHDKEALSSLVGLSYQDFEKKIILLSKKEDAPIRQIGDVWQLISKVDFWLLIAPKISKLYIDKLEAVILKVLSDIDPSYDLPSKERWMANVHGVIPNYSGILKHGLADSLALLAAYADEYTKHFSDGKLSDRINDWVRKLFEENNNTRFWYSLGGCLRPIAEAAPKAFLGAVETASKGDNSVLHGLFEIKSDIAFGRNVYHTNLLWALEQISWNKQYLVRVSLCLAQLSEIELTGNISNTPFNTLSTIYLGWVNNTSATHNERIQILDKVLIEQFPAISWTLMISLLINHSSSSMGISKPQYREWSKNIEKITTIRDYHNYVGDIVDLLLREVDKDINYRLIYFISNFNSYDEGQQQKVIKKLLSIDVNKLTEDSRNKLLTKLRETLSHHKKCIDTEWSWSPDLLDRLENIYHYFSYKDAINANKYLFDDFYPKLIDPIKINEGDWDEEQNIISEQRVLAIETIYKKEGIKGIEQLIDNCSYPRIIGVESHKSLLSNELLLKSLIWLELEGNKGQFAKSYLSVLAYSNIKQAIKLFHNNSTWSEVKKSKFLLCLPLTVDVFSIVNTLLKNKAYYWDNLNYNPVLEEDIGLISSVAKNLLHHNRPFVALNVISYRNKINLNQLDHGLTSTILLEIAYNYNNKDTPCDLLQHKVLAVIKFIQNSKYLDKNIVEQIEWAYLKWFKFQDVKPRFLLKKITENPCFFVQLVIWIFKRNDGKKDPKENLTEEQLSQRIETAWELLETSSIIPESKDTKIDSKLLYDWVIDARILLKEAGRLDIGDSRIGQYLASCPEGQDGICLHEAVRSVIERIKSPELDSAIMVVRMNARGVTSRHPYAGGKQERELAKKYSNDAEKIQMVSPRTAEILRSIARNYEQDANGWDTDVELNI